MRPKVFVTQPVAESALARLRTVADVDVNPDDTRILAKGRLVAAMRRHDLLFSLLHDKVDRDVLAASPKLLAVASMAITPDAIDVAEATRRGIPVTLIPPVVTEATADITFGLILAVARRMLEGDRLLRAGTFPGSQSNHLAGGCVYGKTLGLVGGKGRIGQAVARRAHGFGMRVLYSGPRPLPLAEAAAVGFMHVPFEELLAQSDFVSLHSPFTPETRHTMNDRTLAMMRPGAYLINTARGAIIDEAALIRALKEKKIAGASLDVHEHEPRVALALRKMINVVLTPHLGSAVRELREKMAHIVVDNIFALVEGKVPPNCVNPRVLQGAR
jgi:glyoxylate reductase